jgi:hypothetical protein
MTMNGKQHLVIRAARRALLLAVVLVMLLFVGTVCSAQSSMPSERRQNAAQAQDAKRAAPSVNETQAPATITKQVAPPANAPASIHQPSPAKGQREGVTVHGHWTIEVKNPDGTVVKHVEFENALTVQGRFLLARDLLRRNSTVGTWGIGLGLSSPSGTSPCTAQMTYQSSVFSRGVAYFGPACYIAESLANANLPVSDSDGNIQGSVVSGCQVPVNCSNNLVVGFEDLTDILTPGFTMSGSVVAAQSGTIDTVATFNSACGGSVSPASCLGSPTDPPQIFTQASLPSAPAFGLPAQQPITVTLGQIISVTVVINFS